MGKRIVKDAVVGEKTVIKAAAAIDEVAVRRRRKKAESPKNGKVDHVTVHPEVWSTALDLAGGDRHRIQVIGPEDVVIHNHRDRRLHVAKNGTLHREMPERSSV